MAVTRGATATGRRRAPVTRERLVETAVAIADADGIDALSMRRLGQDLGVEAMSLYHHVAGKDALLDAVVERCVEEILAEIENEERVAPDRDWRATVRARSLAARRVMLRHPWLPSVLQTRTSMGAAVIRLHDGVLGVLVEGGFSYDLAHHTLHALGSRVLGFAQEVFTPGATEEVEIPDPAMMAGLAPHIMAMLASVQHDGPELTLGWCDDQTEFEFGLDVLLEGLAARLART